MSTIDERVVQMSFDNRDFEKNVQTSMSTLERLKQSLNLSGASKGLENVSAAARNVDMSGISGAVDTVRVKFSAMEVAAVTALSNIVNSAVNAGKNLIKALTIDPITSGFSEYETQINAVQTILANTSGTQAEVSKEAIQSVNDTATASTLAAIEANNTALENLEDIHDQALDDFNETADDALDALRKTQKQELKAHQKTADAALKTLQKSQKQELEEYEKTMDSKLDALAEAADEELDALEDKYEEESDALAKTIKAELSALKNAHKEKLALYEEEYYEKLKATDEERYNKLKAINDEIASLKGLTDAEEKANAEAERSAKLSELESRVNNAIGLEERIKAEAALANYKQQIAEEDLLAEREARIEELELSKDAINDEYDLKKEQIKSEYQNKKEEANEVYNLELENLKEEQSERKKLLQENYETQRELLRKTQNEKREALREELEDEKEAIQERHDAERDALKEQQELEKEALLEQQDAEEEALRKQQKLERKALLEQQEAEIAALEASHEVALQNIEVEKSAQIKALYEVARASDSVKATTLEDVNSALDELNEYADKTIYNFTEMTRNIGTFTAAGIDLDTSVAAIKGIANLAAVSGSSSQQASTAMYQLSQAMASGTVKLMDWNSVVNAGMGGKVFQNALTETARVHGIAIDEIIAEQGSFRESLSTGWLTNDILLETLKKFTGDLTEAELEAIGYNEEQIKGIMELGKTANDAATKVKTFTQLMDTLKESAQSGWSQTWEILIGDFEEAKELWTEASEVFGGFIEESARLRNEMLQGWKDLGGRTVLIDAIRNAFEAIGNIIKPIKEAFREIFPRTTSEQLYNMTVALRDFTEKLILNDDQMNLLKQTFKGLFAVLDIGKQALSAVWNFIKPLFGGMGDLVTPVLKVTGGWGEWLVKLRDTIKENNVFTKVLETVKNVLEKVIDYIKDFTGFDFSVVLGGIKTFIDSVKENFSFPGFEGLRNTLTKIKEYFGNIGDAADEMKTNVTNSVDSMGESISKSKVVQVLSGIWEAVKGIASSIAGAVGGLVGGLSDSLNAPDLDTILKIIEGLATGGIAAALIKFINSLSKPFDGLADIGKKIGKVLDSVRGCFEAYQTSLNANSLLKIAGAIAILVASIVVISMIDPVQVNESLATVTMLLLELVGSMAVFSKLSGSLTGITKISIALVAISVALLLLMSAMKKITDMGSEDLATGLMGIVALSTILVTVAKTLSGSSTDLLKVSGGLIVFSIALGTLIPTLAILGLLPLETIGKGLLAMAGSLLIMVTALNSLNDNVGIGGAASLVVVATALGILVPSLAILGSLDLATLAKGLISMGVALGIMVLAINKMDGATGAGSLVVVATALALLVPSLAILGSLKLATLAKGLVTIGLALGIMVLAINKMDGNTGAASLLAISAAMLVLAPALALLGSLELTTIGIALVALAATFAVFGVAAKILKPVVPVILSLASSLALMGVGVLAMGVAIVAAGQGLILLAAGFTALAAAGAAGAVVLVDALKTIIVGIAEVIPTVVTKLGEGVIAFADVIIAGAPKIKEAFVAIVDAIVSALVESIPTIVEGALSLLSTVLATFVEFFPSILQSLGELLVSVLSTVVEFTPTICQSVFDILIAILQTIRDNIKEVVKTGFELLTGFLEGIGEGISDVVQTAVDVVIGFLEGIAKKLPDIIQAGFDLLIAFINGISKAIDENSALLVEAMKNLFLSLIGAALEVLKGAISLIWEAGKKLIDSGLIQGIWEKLGALTRKIGELISAAVAKVTEKVSEWVDAGKELIAKVIKGITDKLKAIKDAVGQLITDAKTAITDKFKEWVSIGGDLISGFIEGITGMASKIKEAALGVIEGAVDAIKGFLGINSPSRLFMEFGRYSDEGLIIGLNDYAGKVADSAEGVGNTAVDAMSKALSGISDIVNSDIDTTPTIKPVIDLSNVEAGASRISTLFSRQQAMSISASMNDTNGGEIQNGAFSKNGTTYQFTQNNYSPKALSRVEIYRQTKNQFSAIERMATS